MLVVKLGPKWPIFKLKLGFMGLYFILEMFYSDSAQRELSFDVKFTSKGPLLTINCHFR